MKASKGPDFWFAQSGFDLRLEWGWRGAERAAGRGDVVVVVDILSFSTVAAFAVARGVQLYPCRNPEEAQAIAERTGAEIGGKRGAARYTMSPRSFADAPAGISVALPTPNGATCCFLARSAPRVFTGAIVNARAVAEAVTDARQTVGGAVTVLACGERWTVPHEDGPLRPSLEDLLGAGAILHALPADWSRSPEARAAQAIYRDRESDLLAALLECGSGIELQDRDFGFDVEDAARRDVFSVAPLLHPDGFLSG